jgi:lactoylglutathione lyase
MRNSILSLASIALSLLAIPALAQLPPGNATGVANGHVHLAVPDAAKHREIWMSFGAEEVSSGRLQLLKFPGMFFLLAEREPTGPSNGSTADHIGFLVTDFNAYRVKLLAVGADFVVDDADIGLLLADLPDGVRVEFRRDTTIANPIEFHHIHLATPNTESLRDWYVDVFGMEVSSRRNLPSALVPGGRVDFQPADVAQAPTQGRAIDHIGFEVDDMDAFAARLRARGIKFDREPAKIEAINLTIAFITDPDGTYIELTEGLAGL